MRNCTGCGTSKTSTPSSAYAADARTDRALPTALLSSVSEGAGVGRVTSGVVFVVVRALCQQPPSTRRHLRLSLKSGTFP
jgi:hypothetical protein